nr:undecaprenyl-phosphate glucose phosphotransferase [Gloeobacter kilaueensis]
MQPLPLPRLQRFWLKNFAAILAPGLIGLTICWDALSVALAYWLAYQVRAASPNALYSPELYLGLAQFSGLSTLLVFAASGLYRAPGYQSRFDEVAKVVIGITIAFTIVVAGLFFFREVSFSRFVLLYAWLAAIAAVATGRLLLQQANRNLRRSGFGVQKVLIVGTGATAHALLQLLKENPQWGLQQAGLVCEDGTSEEAAVVTRLANLGSYLKANEVAEVWFAKADYSQQQLLELVQVATSARQVRIRMVPGILEYITARMQVDVLGGTALLTLRDTPLRSWHNRFWKRLFDAALAALGLFCCLPLFAVVALAIGLTSRGPVLYKQERVGRDGSVFWIYKFRTMKVDAESQGHGWTTKEDPRRTRVGSFLRRTSLDELPQLWNVLKGEMSLVGPRPERPYYVERFSQDIPKYIDRHLVKTGMTGWAQIHGLRGDTSIAKRVKYDLYYIENWSLLLDIRIILSTVWQILLNRTDAY